MDDTFKLLWADASDPSDRDDDERRDLAEHFYRHGVIAERARIRKQALSAAERIENSHLDDFDPEGIYDAAANSLRDFAALLEDRR